MGAFFRAEGIRRFLANGLARYKRVPARRLLDDRLRAIQLRRVDPIIVPQTAGRERIVVTLTTIPERVGMIRPVLRSLLHQARPADRILLAWPERSRRTGIAYPQVPRLPRGVEILHCQDDGPATKLLATLKVEPDSILVAVDDDVIYPHDFLATLLEAHRKEPTAAIGLRGWRLLPGVEPKRLRHVFCSAVDAPTDVDVLLGTWGYMIPPHALDHAVHNFDGWPPEVRWVDDVWISGHLARRKVPRRVISANSFPIETKASRVASLSGNLNKSGLNDSVAVRAFSAYW